MDDNLFVQKENRGIERVIDYYIEIEEKKKELQRQQTVIEIIVEKFFKENPNLHQYKTLTSQVEIIKEKRKLNPINQIRLVELALQNNLNETLIPIWNKRLRKYLAIKKKDFEIYRQYNLADYKYNKHMQEIRDILINKNKYELLTFNKKILQEVIDMMIYDQNQKNCAAKILKSLQCNVLTFKKINNK